MNDDTQPSPAEEAQPSHPPEVTTESASPAPQVDPATPPAQDPPAAAPHPARALLSRIESEVDGMLHSPLALANWVKSMVAEVRQLL